MKTNFIKKNDMLPISLCKNFTSADDAQNFKRGHILIRKIEYHKKWERENQRLDTSENQASYYYKTDNMTINGGLTYINPVYILSTSGPDSDRAKCKTKFGGYEVRVINPALFKVMLQKAWEANSLVPAFSFNVFQVEYSKGELREEPPYMLEPHGLSLYQKSKDHIDDDEYRFVFVCNMNPSANYPDALTLNIDSKDIFV
ncbi:MAG: hypothetical protein AB1306_06410 [Nitrospirota bacterium]